MSLNEFYYFSLIPEEVLRAILLHLPKKDLQNVRLVCKSLNEIISNSPPIMRAFDISQSHLVKSLKWLHISKYSHLKIDDTPRLSFSTRSYFHFQTPILMDAVEIMRSHLLKLDIDSSNYTDAVMVQNILVKCTNLKELHFVDHGLVIDEVKGELPRLNLNVLKVTNQSKIYDLLINSSVKSFHLTIRGNCPSNLSLRRFIMQQTNLQKMTINIPNIIRKLMPDELIATLSSDMKKPGDLPIKVVTGTISITGHLNFFANLQNLRVLDINLNKKIKNMDFRALPQVGHLKINANKTSLSAFGGKFPNLKSLEVTNHSIMTISSSYIMLMKIMVGSHNLDIKKAPHGIDDFRSCRSKFTVCHESSYTAPLSSPIVVYLKNVYYGEYEIKTEGIFIVNGQILKVKAVNQRLRAKFESNIRRESLNYFDKCWEEIFTYLPKKDLLEVIKVSKFNEIVSKSIELLRKLSENSNREFELKLYEKISKLKLKKYEENSALADSLKDYKNPKNLKCFEVVVCKNQSPILLRCLLLMYPKIQALKIYEEKTEVEDTRTTLKLPKVKLKYLEVVEATFLLDIFAVCYVDELNIQCKSDMNYEEVKPLMRFLSSHDELQSFKLENFNGDFEIMSGTKFIPKRLEFISCKSMEQQIRKFISLNKTSLESFKLDNVKNLEILLFLSFFRNLKELDVEINFDNCQKFVLKMNHVVDLKLSIIEAEHYDVMKLFPNLTSLNVSNMHSLEILELPHLTNLKMVDSYFDVTSKIPNIKDLTLINCTLLSKDNFDYPMKDYNVRKIDVKTKKLLEEFLRRKFPKLKEVMLIDVSMTKNFL